MRPKTLSQSLAAAFADLDHGRADEARRIARALAKQRPDLPGLDYLEGLLALEEKAGAKAARHLAQALKHDPDAPPLLLAAARAQAMQGRDAEAEAHYRRLLALAPDTEAARKELATLLLRRGVVQRDGGDLHGARKHFAEAANLDPDAVLGHWLLAEASRALGQAEDATRAYRRVLDLDSEDRYGASLALAALGANPPPGRAPDAFLRSMFDQYAERFDESLIDKLHYRAPKLLADAIRRLRGTGPFTIFDAGCGTGLMGLALGGMIGALDGADLSPAMIERAQARGLYRNLQCGDFITILAARSTTYDLVVAADVLVYIGDLNPVFAAVASSLRPNGLFAFTVEKVDGDGWLLADSGRYAHSRAYLLEQAAKAGMEIKVLDDVSTREDRGHPVPGLLCLAEIAA